MQLTFLWGKREKPKAPPVVTPNDELELDGGRKITLVFRRNNLARRYLLRLNCDGAAQMTVPRRGSLKQARAFAESHRAWLLRQLIKWETAPKISREWGQGTAVYFRGELIALQISPSGDVVFLGAEQIALHQGKSVRRHVESHFLRIARRELPDRVRFLAAMHGCAISQISIRNQSSRWGSCSSRGTISLNWRLVQMPSAVSDYIILHELMHTREMNHSRRFWAYVADVCPDYKRHEAWLKTHGREINAH